MAQYVQLRATSLHTARAGTQPAVGGGAGADVPVIEANRSEYMQSTSLKVS